MNHLLFVIQVELAEDLFGSKMIDPRHKHQNRDVSDRILGGNRWSRSDIVGGRIQLV